MLWGNSIKTAATIYNNLSILLKLSISQPCNPLEIAITIKVTGKHCILLLRLPYHH